MSFFKFGKEIATLANGSTGTIAPPVPNEVVPGSGLEEDGARNASELVLFILSYHSLQYCIAVSQEDVAKLA